MLAGLHSGLGDRSADYLAILLTAPGEADPEDFNDRASALWHRFTTYLRRAWGDRFAELEFWRVAELQARGHVHFHVVIRGAAYLPITNASGTGLRDLAVKAGFGPWVGVRRPRDYPGGVRSLGHYFGKYLLKTYLRRGAVAKLVTFSQGWRTAWVRPPKREGASPWAVLPKRDPWGALAYFTPPAREAPPRAAAPSWWRQAWQWARAREARPIDMWDGAAIVRD